MTNTEKPIACTLSGTSFATRTTQIRALFARALIGSKREGNRLHLAFAAEARDDVARLVELERACCAFLDFDLREGENTVELTITAPDGTSAGDLFAPFVSSRL